VAPLPVVSVDEPEQAAQSTAIPSHTNDSLLIADSLPSITPTPSRSAERGHAASPKPAPLGQNNDTGGRARAVPRGSLVRRGDARLGDPFEVSGLLHAASHVRAPPGRDSGAAAGASGVGVGEQPVLAASESTSARNRNAERLVVIAAR